MSTALLSVWKNYEVFSSCKPCNSSSILYYVLVSFSDRVSQNGVIGVGISDHQLTDFWTTFPILYLLKTPESLWIKSYYHEQITFPSLINYSPDFYEEALKKLNFPNYELFDDIYNAYENFIQNVMAVTDYLALSIKTLSIKH